MDNFQNLAEYWGWWFGLRLPQAVEKNKFATAQDVGTSPVLPNCDNVWGVGTAARAQPPVGQFGRLRAG